MKSSLNTITGASGRTLAEVSDRILKAALISGRPEITEKHREDLKNELLRRHSEKTKTEGVEMKQNLFIKLPDCKNAAVIEKEWFEKAAELLKDFESLKEMKTIEDYMEHSRVLNKISKTLKRLEDKRQEISSPFLNAQRLMKSASDRASAPLSEAMEQLKNAIGQFAVEFLEQEKQKRHAFISSQNLQKKFTEEIFGGKYSEEDTALFNSETPEDINERKNPLISNMKIPNALTARQNMTRL